MIDRSQTFQNVYSYDTVNSISIEIQPDSTNIKNDPRTFLGISMIIKIWINMKNTTQRPLQPKWIDPIDMSGKFHSTQMSWLSTEYKSYIPRNQLEHISRSPDAGDIHGCTRKLPD